MVLVCVTIALFVRSDVVKLQRSRTLDTRGLGATATVKALSYDEGGGDPGGVTTLTVGFVTADGVTEEAVVWHHDRPTETVGDPVSVLYDPRDPSNVEATVSHVDPLDEVALGAAILAVCVVGLVALVVCDRVIERRSRSRTGRAASS